MRALEVQVESVWSDLTPEQKGDVANLVCGGPPVIQPELLAMEVA